MSQGSDPWACEVVAGSASTLRPVTARAATTASNLRIGPKRARPRISDHSILVICAILLEYGAYADRASLAGSRQYPTTRGIRRAVPPACRRVREEEVSP